MQIAKKGPVTKTVHVILYLFTGRVTLNRQIITLMSCLGVQDHVFLKLQEEMIFDVANILIDNRKAHSALIEVLQIVPMMKYFSLIMDSVFA